MRSRRNPFSSSQFPVNVGEASFNSVCLGATGSGISGKTTGFILGRRIGDSTGGMFGVGSGFSGVFSWVSISIVLILVSSGFLSFDGSFFFNIFQKSFSTGSDSSGAVW